MTITDLDTYRHNVNGDPADLLQVIATRRIWAWIADDLRKRRKKLQQAVSTNYQERQAREAPEGARRPRSHINRNK